MENKKHAPQQEGQAENERANYIPLGSDRPVSRDFDLEDKERMDEPEETSGDLAGNASGNDDADEQ
ncbi:MAG: hypothetical protein EOO07_17485 [Chitinophagaceae bacterium]|nr:MAG: hypothetical protein EOO07_17485 [Chitinophagaceae bacterium]